MTKKILLLLLLVLIFHAGWLKAQTRSIRWDSTSARQLSAKQPHSYNDYARMIQLNDSSLFAVFGNGDSGIICTRSYDLGNTWSKPYCILKNTVSHRMDNAEIIQLRDGSLMVSTNLRPIGGQQNKDTASRFQIGMIRSTDGGKHWSPLRILYTASWRFKDGCWEPKVMQRPDGIVEMYFSDEYPYKKNSDQNISLLTADEHVEHWSSKQQLASYRKHHRDGMPSPIVLLGDSVTAMAIEDNGYFDQFKISIIRNAIAEHWSKYVNAKSRYRAYALKGYAAANESSTYAGAPYLVRMNDGSTILSFQSNKGRSKTPDPLSNCQPTVMVGDANAENFQSTSTPFNLPDGKTGLWNSLCALNNGEVILLTGTNAFSSDGSGEIWMIKGKLEDRNR